MSALRIALLDLEAGPQSRTLARGLRDAGHEAQVIGLRGFAPVEALLHRRGFTPGLTHAPPAAVALARGGFDVAHAFSPLDAAAALAWRRRSRRPVAFTCTEPLDRARLADGRLRLWSLRRAFEQSDALVASSEAVREAMERWFALDVPLIDSRDAAAHERLYRDLIGRRAG